MNETKHTPGPWRLAQYTNYIGFSIYSESETTFGCITERWEKAPSKERQATMQANAAFIVEACNQHERLLKALKKIDDMDFDAGTPYELADKMAECARAAIAGIGKELP